MKASDNDADFETWYQKEKNGGLSGSEESSGTLGPHAVGDVIEGEGKRWVVTSKARRDGIIFIYEVPMAVVICPLDTMSGTEMVHGGHRQRTRKTAARKLSSKSCR